MQSVTTSGQRDKTSPKSKSEINPQKKKCASGKIATCPQRTVTRPQKMRTTKSTPIWRMFYRNYIIKAACAMKSYLFLHCIFILLAVTNQLIELKSFIPVPHPSLFQISTYLALQGNLISKTFANFQNINSKKHNFPLNTMIFQKKQQNKYTINHEADKLSEDRIKATCKHSNDAIITFLPVSARPVPPDGCLDHSC